MYNPTHTNERIWNWGRVIIIGISIAVFSWCTYAYTIHLEFELITPEEKQMEERHKKQKRKEAHDRVEKDPDKASKKDKEKAKEYKEKDVS